MNQEPSADSPVFLTLAGADAAKVKPMATALTQIGELAATCPDNSWPWTLGKIVGAVIVVLEAVGETEAAEHVRAVSDAQRPAWMKLER